MDRAGVELPLVLAILVFRVFPQGLELLVFLAFLVSLFVPTVVSVEVVEKHTVDQGHCVSIAGTCGPPEPLEMAREQDLPASRPVQQS